MDEVKKLSKSFENVKDSFVQVLSSAGHLTGVILIITGAILIITELATFYKTQQIKKWNKYPGAGKVINTYVEQKSEMDGYGGFIFSNYSSVLLYRTRVAFTYVIDDVTHTSYQYSYFEPWYDNPTIPQDEKDTLPKGKVVDIYINPADPKEAYITNKPYTHLDPIAIGIAVVFSGIYIIKHSN